MDPRIFVGASFAAGILGALLLPRKARASPVAMPPLPYLVQEDVDPQEIAMEPVRVEAPPAAPAASPADWEAHVQRLLADSRGWPYSRNMGTPQTPWEKGRRGVDCSGYAQMALVRMGILSPNAPDKSSYALYLSSRILKPGEQRPGDLTFYGSKRGIVHVEVVASIPGVDGHSVVQGATTSGVKARHALSWERLADQPRFVAYGRIA